MFYALGRSLRHVLDKATWLHFQNTSKEVIWHKKILNFIPQVKKIGNMALLNPCM